MLVLNYLKKLTVLSTTTNMLHTSLINSLEKLLKT